MLQLSATIPQRNVLSLRTGTPIAQVTEAIIDPDTLVIIGFYCQELDDKQRVVLLCQDIREIVSNGFVVNDLDALSDPDELVRHKDLLSNNFRLLQLPVETINGTKIGKVTDFAFDTTTMLVKKLYASQSFFKHITSGSLSIDRSQIHEITVNKVIIQDLLEPVKAAAPTAQTA